VVVHDDLVAPVVLGIVEGGVGAPDEAREVLAGGGFNDAEADRVLG